MAGVRWREWWNTMAFPTRRIWNRFTVRVGFRHSGLLRLQNDVSSCEYEDIHIMWNLLHKNEIQTPTPTRGARIQQRIQQRKKACWNLLIGSYLCQRF
ncbi:hypothetical protein EUTSA_v10003296mg [Eutrema salsugineum]|uniref:Uncharacterized protein n=1 Tax=Eutrema salsugineum TaxID=72664 RepID=V4L345_EUTSA|nr:uncharacterized protein LOC18020488 [Eutrema salsugineum]ESQ44740.1 hypothetical protein EUTSA_v10003296mg [Eutrema salsugineum]